MRGLFFAFVVNSFEILGKVKCTTQSFLKAKVFTDSIFSDYKLEDGLRAEKSL